MAVQPSETEEKMSNGLKVALLALAAAAGVFATRPEAENGASGAAFAAQEA